MSRWDIFRWRTLAGGPPCRQGRQRFSHRAFLSPRPKRVPPFGISDGGETRRSASAVSSRCVAARDNSRGLHPGQFAGVAPLASRALGR